MAQLALWLTLGYLSGSLPTAYLVAKYLRGIDIRDYGSGNAGGANIYTHVAPWAALLVGLIDAIKAAAPTLLALCLAGSQGIAAAAGIGAVIGHCWSLYLDFTGGRGMAPTLGALLLLFPQGAAYIIVLHLLGSAARLAAAADFVALATLPLLALVLLGNAPPVWMGLAIFLVVAAKRLHANRLPLPQDPAQRRAVLRRRLIYDRDVPRGQPWAEREAGIRSRESADKGQKIEEGTTSSPPAP